MAERLTEYFECGAYTEKQNIIDVSDKVKFFDNGCVMGKAIDKLAKLEDIMDKYGIDSFDLLEHIIKKGMVINSVIDDFAKEEYDKMKQDRDTWHKACELACDTLKQVMGKPLWIGGNIPTPEVKDSEYFYQQAKTEGNDE